MLELKYSFSQSQRIINGIDYPLIVCKNRVGKYLIKAGVTGSME